MGLEIAQELEGAVRILSLRGRLDTDTSADLELAMQDLLGAGERVFLIDLREVGYVSSAGLRVLLAVAKKLEGSKGTMRLCGLSPAVTQVFDVAGFSRLFAISPDRASALAGMAVAVPKPAHSSLATQAARLLRVTDGPVPRTDAGKLARDVAQLLGVKPGPLPVSVATSAAVAVPISVPAVAAKNQSFGMLGKLRGMFGRKN